MVADRHHRVVLIRRLRRRPSAAAALLAALALTTAPAALGCGRTTTTEAGDVGDPPVASAPDFPPEAQAEGSALTVETATTIEPTTSIAASSSAAPTSEPGPTFSSNVAPIDPELGSAMTGVSWRPGCPVPLEDLRRLTVTHWTFDGTTDVGTLIVHRDVADGLAGVFRRLFEQGFAIRQMVPVHTFGGTGNPEDGADDYASIEADNTSAFNCRQRTGGGEFSQHSYGTALDLNPLENPYVTATGTTSHSKSEPYLDRSEDGQGVISSGGGVEAAFAKAGWQWGGNWSGVIDYQHFSVNGR